MDADDDEPLPLPVLRLELRRHQQHRRVVFQMVLFCMLAGGFFLTLFDESAPVYWMVLVAESAITLWIAMSAYRETGRIRGLEDRIAWAESRLPGLQPVPRQSNVGSWLAFIGTIFAALLATGGAIVIAYLKQ